MYIELIMLVDFFFNYIILITTAILLNRIIKLKRVFISSLIGVFSIVFVLFFNKMNVILVSSFLMCIIAFKYETILYTLKNLLYVYFSSMFYGGVVYLINVNFFNNYNNVLVYLVILFVFIPIVTYVYIKNIKNVIFNNSKYYYLDIYISGNEKIRVVSFLDTGNKLMDPYFHKPIILLNRSLLKEVNNKILYVPYNTVNSHSLLECIVPDKVEIDGLGLIKNVLVGLVDSNNIPGVYCIMNEKIIERNLYVKKNIRKNNC